MTMPWLKQSTACTKQKSYIKMVPGDLLSTWIWRLSTGSKGITIKESWSHEDIFRLRTMRCCILNRKKVWRKSTESFYTSPANPG